MRIPIQHIAASHVMFADGTQHVFYRAAAEGDTDSQIIELWWRPG
jgi:hypothetical protein